MEKNTGKRKFSCIFLYRISFNGKNKMKFKNVGDAMRKRTKDRKGRKHYRRVMAGLTGAALLSSVMATGMPTGKAQPITDKSQESQNNESLVDKYKDYFAGKLRELYDEKVAEKKQEIMEGIFNLNKEDFKHLKANKVLDIVATAYTSGPEDNGIWNDKTHIGTKVRPGIVAVDPKVIPLGTKVYIEFPTGEGMYAVAEDTGGAIKGNRIDIAMSTREKAKQFGIQDVKVHVLEKVLDV